MPTTPSPKTYFLFAFLVLAGCSSEPRTLIVEVTTGHETNAMQEDPPVVRVNVTATAADGELTVSASAAPGGELDFGEVPSDKLVTFEVTGVDSAGNTIMRGRSLAVVLAAVQSEIIPVFAQRVGQWARPPSELVTSHAGGCAAVLAERYLLLTGGTASADPKAIEAYDLFSYGASRSSPLQRQARSVVYRGNALLVIDDAGASWVDFETGIVTDPALPQGLPSWQDVAGGQTINAPDGRSFIVGATRSSDMASTAVLVVLADGTLTANSLQHPRARSSGVWVDDVGLVVVGGNTTDPGVEVLKSGASAFATLPFAPDPTQGAGATVASGQVVLVGGVLNGQPASTRQLDPTCLQDCLVTDFLNATLPVAVDGVTAYALNNGRVMAVGQEPLQNGLIHTFVVELATSSVMEIPLREARTGATTIPAPNGTLALLGGMHPDGTEAKTIEMLFPQ